MLVGYNVHVQNTVKKMSKLSKKIKSGARKDAGALYEDLCDLVEDKTQNKAELKSTIGILSELLTDENALMQERKKLSRQVGAVRKEGGDPQDLIVQVSTISAKVKDVSSRIDDTVSELESTLQSSAESTSTENRKETQKWPVHLAFQQKSGAKAEGLQLTHTDRIDVSEWQSFVDSIAHSNVYHDAAWCELIKSNFKHTPCYITCREPDGSLCGVFPVIHLQSKLFGSFMISVPYFNYGGPLSESGAIDKAMLAYAADIAGELNCSHLEVRDTCPREGWVAKQHKVTMILPLPENDEVLDKQLGTKIRAQVNRAAREGLEFNFGGSELLPDFYRVFSRNMRDLGTPVYDKQFFASILETFPEKAHLAVVRHGDKPVAAGFLLGHKDKLEIPWASSLREANPLGVNMFLYRQILRVSIESGYAFFDFGRSSIDASTYKFKKQWGADEHPLYWHYWLKDADELPELNPNNPKYKLAISVWQRLPVVVANAIGPKLVRNLP